MRKMLIAAVVGLAGVMGTSEACQAQSDASAMLDSLQQVATSQLRLCEARIADAIATANLHRINPANPSGREPAEVKEACSDRAEMTVAGELRNVKKVAADKREALTALDTWHAKFSTALKAIDGMKGPNALDLREVDEAMRKAKAGLSI